MPIHRSRIPSVLAPGTRIVPRGRQNWQVGINPGRRVLIPDSAENADQIDALKRGASTSTTTDLTAALARAGLLAVAPAPPVRVVVRGDLGVDIEPILAHSGILRAPTGATDAPGLFLSIGEPAREDLDPWLRQGRTHIIVRIVDGQVIVGPLVVPMQTACLRCIDCHHIDLEPEHYAVLHRYVHSTRSDGHDDTLPPLTTLLAITWALHDLTNHEYGIRPVTHSSTLTFGDDGLECVAWHRHPECACSWSST